MFRPSAKPLTLAATVMAVAGTPETVRAECPPPSPEALKTVDTLLAQSPNLRAVDAYDESRTQTADTIDALNAIEPDTPERYAQFLGVARTLLARRGLSLDTSRLDASIEAAGYSAQQPNHVMTQFGKPAIVESVNGAYLINPEVLRSSGATVISMYFKWSERADSAAYVFGDQPPGVVSVNAASPQNPENIIHEASHLLFAKLCGYTTHTNPRNGKVRYELHSNPTLAALNPGPIYNEAASRIPDNPQVASSISWGLELKKLERGMRGARRANNRARYAQLLERHTAIRQNVLVAESHGLLNDQEDAAELVDSVLTDPTLNFSGMFDPSLSTLRRKTRWAFASLADVTPVGVNQVFAIATRPTRTGEYAPPTWKQLGKQLKSSRKSKR